VDWNKQSKEHPQRKDEAKCQINQKGRLGKRKKKKPPTTKPTLLEKFSYYTPFHELERTQVLCLKILQL